MTTSNCNPDRLPGRIEINDPAIARTCNVIGKDETAFYFENVFRGRVLSEQVASGRIDNDLPQANQIVQAASRRN